MKEQILAFLEYLRTDPIPSSEDRRFSHRPLPQAINQWLAIAATHGAEGGLTDPDGAALVRSEVVAALTHRHAARKHYIQYWITLKDLAAKRLENTVLTIEA